MSTLRTTTLQDIDTGLSVAVLELIQTQGLSNVSDPAKGAALIGRGGQVVTSIANLRLLLKTSPSKFAFATGYYVSGDGGGGAYFLDEADLSSADNAGTVIVAADGGRWKLSTTVPASLRQFGGKGDNSTNDTAAVAAAVAYIASTGRSVYVPAGTFLSDPIVLNMLAFDLQGSFIGEDRQRSVLKRRTAGAGAFFTIGALTSTSYQTGGGLSDITINGGASSNGPAFLGYDMVRTSFDNVHFQGGFAAVQLKGGISLAFNDCLVDQGQYGYHIDKYPGLTPGSFSPAGGGWPNIIRIRGGEVVDNTVWGVWFDSGRMLLIDDCEVEGNGTTLGAAEGGMYIGPNVGQEVSGTDSFSPGVVCTGSWFEGNRGAADIALSSGVNSIENAIFFSNGASVTNAVSISGGRYYLRNPNFSVPLTLQVSEGPGVATGNLIESSDMATYSVDFQKTTVMANNSTQVRGGQVPAVTNLAKPLIQVGNGATGASGITVTFPVAYVGIPTVFVTVSNGDSTTTLTQAVISSITATGFFVRGLSITSGSSTIAQQNLGFNWQAVGTK